METNDVNKLTQIHSYSIRFGFSFETDTKEKYYIEQIMHMFSKEPIPETLINFEESFEDIIKYEKYSEKIKQRAGQTEILKYSVGSLKILSVINNLQTSVLLENGRE